MIGFRDSNGNKIENLFEYVKNWIDNNPKSEIFIGCDSQEFGSNISYVTAVCLYKQGNGAHIIYKKEKLSKSENYNRKTNIEPKLWLEVTKSVEVAEQLKNLNKKITVHVDYSPDQTQKSNRFYEAGLGYVKSMGFNAEGKPYAWAASCAADNYCR